MHNHMYMYLCLLMQAKPIELYCTCGYAKRTAYNCTAMRGVGVGVKAEVLHVCSIIAMVCPI